MKTKPSMVLPLVVIVPWIYMVGPDWLAAAYNYIGEAKYYWVLLVLTFGFAGLLAWRVLPKQRKRAVICAPNTSIEPNSIFGLGGLLLWRLLPSQWKRAKICAPGASIEPDELQRMLMSEELPGFFYMLVWGELDETSEAHRALSQVLFDYDSAEAPNGAPARNLGEPALRKAVTDCALAYHDIRIAAEKILLEIIQHHFDTIWCQAAVQLDVNRPRSFGEFLEYLEDRLEEHGDYKVAFGLLPTSAHEEVILKPIVNVYVDKSERDLIMQTATPSENGEDCPAPLSLLELTRKMKPFRLKRTVSNVECSESSFEESLTFAVHMPIAATGFNHDLRLFVCLSNG